MSAEGATGSADRNRPEAVEGLPALARRATRTVGGLLLAGLLLAGGAAVAGLSDAPPEAAKRDLLLRFGNVAAAGFLAAVITALGLVPLLRLLRALAAARERTPRWALELPIVLSAALAAVDSWSWRLDLSEARILTLTVPLALAVFVGAVSLPILLRRRLLARSRPLGPLARLHVAVPEAGWALLPALLCAAAAIATSGEVGRLERERLRLETELAPHRAVLERFDRLDELRRELVGRVRVIQQARLRQREWATAGRTEALFFEVLPRDLPVLGFRLHAPTGRAWLDLPPLAARPWSELRDRLEREPLVASVELSDREGGGRTLELELRVPPEGEHE